MIFGKMFPWRQFAGGFLIQSYSTRGCVSRSGVPARGPAAAMPCHAAGRLQRAAVPDGGQRVIEADGQRGHREGPRQPACGEVYITHPKDAAHRQNVQKISHRRRYNKAHMNLFPGKALEITSRTQPYNYIQKGYEKQCKLAFCND